MLTDANGDERKGIEIDMLADGEEGEKFIRLYNAVPGVACWCFVNNLEIGLSDREKETVRDLTLAGF